MPPARLLTRSRDERDAFNLRAQAGSSLLYRNALGSHTIYLSDKIYEDSQVTTSFLLLPDIRRLPTVEPL